MNITPARRIDYWIGIPICFFLSIYNRINNLFNKKDILLKEPKKFLFIELSEMGSAILAYPAMRYIKNNYPDAELFFLIFEKNRPSVDILKIIEKENVYTIRDNSFLMLFKDAMNVLSKIRAEEFDVVFDLEFFTRITAILTFLSKAKKKVGFFKYKMEGLYRGRLLTHELQFNWSQHISKTFLSFPKVLKEPEKHSPEIAEVSEKDEITLPTYSSTEENLNTIWRKLKARNNSISRSHRLIILTPGAGELPIRGWPLENYIELGRKLLQDKSNYLVFTGTKKDKEETKSIIKKLENPQCIDLTGETNFTELVDLFNLCDLLIVCDSGPAHFATLTRIQSIVLFGPGSPKIWSPLGDKTSIVYAGLPCSPCLTAFNHRNTKCENNLCMQSISVEEVFRIACEKLKRDPDSTPRSQELQQEID
ncbi:MAG: glycosyltransferase family 9 protein [Nitrospinota bacterium]|nr:glycosyltransferase family 9 protein [Nitrospinota bacterium]